MSHMYTESNWVDLPTFPAWQMSCPWQRSPHTNGGAACVLAVRRKGGVIEMAVEAATYAQAILRAVEKIEACEGL